MGWMLRRCPRFRVRWRMSSSFPTGGVAVECDGCAPLGVRVLLFVLECDVLWR